jgi:ParB/RepB/Spo0J family partition protein
MTATATRPKAPARVQCPHCTYSGEPGSSIAGHVAMAHPDVPIATVSPKRSARNDEPTPAAPAAELLPVAGAAPLADATLEEIPLELVDVGDNVRVTLEAVDELAASIAEHGVLQPVKATLLPSGRYSLLWGQRRVLAARKAGLATILALVYADEPDDRPIEQLVENLHRADLNPIDRARAMRDVVDSGVSQAELARKLGIAPSTVANDLRLLETAPKVQELLAAGSLTPAHVKAIAGLGLEDQAELAEKAVKDGWSAHDAERQAKWAKESVAQRQANREATIRQTAQAIALLEKVANRKRSTISIASYSGRDVRSALQEDGWKVVDEWLDVVQEPGACGCAGVWRLDIPYGNGKVELKPACKSEDHKKARQVEREAAWAKQRTEAEAWQVEREAAWAKQRTEAEAERAAADVAATARAKILQERLVDVLGTPFGQRVLLYALAVDNDSVDDNLINAFWDGDRQAVYDLDDATWTLIEKVPDDQLAKYIALALGEALTSCNSGPGVSKAIDEYFAPETSS